MALYVARNIKCHSSQSPLARDIAPRFHIAAGSIAEHGDQIPSERFRKAFVQEVRVARVKFAVSYLGGGMTGEHGQRRAEGFLADRPK